MLPSSSEALIRKLLAPGPSPNGLFAYFEGWFGARERLWRPLLTHIRDMLDFSWSSRCKLYGNMSGGASERSKGSRSET